MIFQERAREDRRPFQIPALEFDEERAAEDHLEREVSRQGRHPGCPQRAKLP